MTSDQLREALRYHAANPGPWYSNDKTMADAVRLLLDGPLSDILELRGEQVEEVWVCVHDSWKPNSGNRKGRIYRSHDGKPWRPPLCLVGQTRHRGCGPRLLVKQGTTEGADE